MAGPCQRTTLAVVVLAALGSGAAPLRAAATPPDSRTPRASMDVVVEQRPAPICVVSLAHGATLVAGSRVTLAWEPLAGFEALAQAEEWEAFLSVDGGVSYPIRLTPHLDLDVRRVGFRVPAVPTADARLLFRFGDERRESAFDVPLGLSIVAPVAAPPLADPDFLLSQRSAVVAGEPAFPGTAGVQAWAEGSRRAERLRQVAGAAREGLSDPQASPSASPAEEAATSDERPIVTTAPGPLSSGISHAPARRSPPAIASAPRADILLLTGRRNE